MKTVNTSQARKGKTLFLSEDNAQKKKRIAAILRTLLREFPDPKCALNHHAPFQLLIATILSAQCTDERVNMVTPVLFKAYPTPKAIADAPIESLIEIIRSTGFYQNKSKSIKACARAIVEKHDGKVPDTMEALTALPGVGRKTANVVLGNAFGIPGLAVDTHVTRISNLLQFTDSTDAEVIEQHLCSIVPKSKWTDASHLLILHGRKTCIARRPKCAECDIEKYCPSSVLKAEG